MNGENNFKIAQEIALSIRNNGLWCNFDCKLNNSDRHIEEYFKNAKGFYKIFKYSNAVDSEVKNAAVRLFPNVFDLVEAIDKSWLDENLADYFKNGGNKFYKEYIKNNPDRCFILCVSKAFKQIVVLEQQIIEGVGNTLRSIYPLDGNCFRTDSLEYAIIDSCFYRKECYYKGIDWNVDKNNYAIIGHMSSQYYNPLMYCFNYTEFHSDNIQLTNFHINLKGLLDDYIKIKKYDETQLLNILKKEISDIENKLNSIKRNKAKIMLEYDIAGMLDYDITKI